MAEPLDALDLGEGRRLAIVTDADGLAALPAVRENGGGWRRARPGDGAAEALLELLARTPGSQTHGLFTVHSWTQRTALGEQEIGVDQTNESVVVGAQAVVKWATHLQEGPHPAPRRIRVLRDAGFSGMPASWGMVTWRPADGPETLAVSVDQYLPGAVDGWTWAVEEITDGARDRQPASALAAASAVGTLIADLHAALSSTATVASREDAARWRGTAVSTLETVCALDDSPSVAFTRARRGEIVDILNSLETLAGTPVIEGHGDLHVGQVLRSDRRYVVTDFDGNPIVSAAGRMLPIPPALDVAGMTQSLAHAAIVAARYTDLDGDALAELSASVLAAFLQTYTDRITALGHGDLYDPRPLRAFRVQQVLREIIYATRHLPRWMYVPDAALPALLDERDRS